MAIHRSGKCVCVYVCVFIEFKRARVCVCMHHIQTTHVIAHVFACVGEHTVCACSVNVCQAVYFQKPPTRHNAGAVVVAGASPDASSQLLATPP